MLRTLVALLLIANLVFFGWSQGWLDPLVGVRARGDREPERLARQVRPELVRILTTQPATAAASAADPTLACLEAGPFDAAGIDAAEGALSTILPSGTWTRQSIDRPASWIVYMGRYANVEAQQKKEQELTRRQVAFEELSGAPQLEPGLVLGRFTERDAADDALAQFVLHGVQTARVVELAQASTVHMLRVEHANPEMAQRVSGLRLDALGKGFVPCAARS
jgi:hypothetical protein